MIGVGLYADVYQGKGEPQRSQNETKTECWNSVSQGPYDPGNGVRTFPARRWPGRVVNCSFSEEALGCVSSYGEAFSCHGLGCTAWSA